MRDPNGSLQKHRGHISNETTAASRKGSPHLGANNAAVAVEIKLRVFAKAGGVVVHAGGGVAKSLQQRVHLDDALLNVLPLVARVAQVDDVAHQQLGALGLAGARLTTAAHIRVTRRVN